MLRCNMQENCSTISLRSVLDISCILTRRIAEHGYVTYVTQHADSGKLQGPVVGLTSAVLSS